MTREQQEQLGLRAMGEVYKQMPVLPDSSALTEYVQQLGRKLQTVIPSQYSWPYQFHVVPQKEINAFALPGGPIFVNVGTITAADNEAELAGVIAHEMAHVYMQHSAKQAPKQQWLGVLGALGGAVAGGVLGGAAGSLAQMGVQIGAGAVLTKYSRGDEAQADAVGAIIMYKAGYNPQAMAQFFQKLEQQGGEGGGPQFLSDHPDPGNRVAAVTKEIQDWPAKNYLGNSPQFASAKSDASQMRAYSAQEIANGAKQGLWQRQNAQGGAVPRNTSGSQVADASSTPTISNVSYQQVRPSSNFNRLRGGVFSIQYPDNWRAGSDTGSSSVAIVAPGGSSQGAIAYGVLISGDQKVEGQSLDTDTRALIQQLQQQNPGLQSSGSVSTINVNGVLGRSAELLGNSPVTQNGQPLRERDWLVTVPSPQGGLLYMVFIAPDRDFSQLRPTYQRMLDSLQLQ
ncbi:MAG: M48 family metalloprotease [Acidobacteriales bacterium]|nr:M48 family metalloprotease [Terriglobales bacterium]